MRSSELGSGAGDGTFLRSVAEAGESAVVTSFRSNGCRSKVGPTNVAERLTGKFLKVSTFSIAVAMILVLGTFSRLYWYVFFGTLDEDMTEIG